jgi:hypothetical protein
MYHSRRIRCKGLSERRFLWWGQTRPEDDPGSCLATATGRN